MSSPSIAAKSPIVSAALAVSSAVRAATAAARAGWKAQRNRRAVVGLLHFDDHMLRDIGLTSGDVAASLAGPLMEDPSARLRILAVERRAARRAQTREWLEADRAVPAAAPTSERDFV